MFTLFLNPADVGSSENNAQNSVVAFALWLSGPLFHLLGVLVPCQLFHWLLFVLPALV